jgi:hypothetical protein
VQAHFYWSVAKNKYNQTTHRSSQRAQRRSNSNLCELCALLFNNQSVITICTSPRNNLKRAHWKVRSLHRCIFPEKNAHSIATESDSGTSIGKSRQHTFHFLKSNAKKRREKPHFVLAKWKVLSTPKNQPSGKCKRPRKQGPIHPWVMRDWKVVMPNSTTWPIAFAPPIVLTTPRLLHRCPQFPVSCPLDHAT